MAPNIRPPGKRSGARIGAKAAGDEQDDQFVDGLQRNRRRRRPHDVIDQAEQRQASGKPMATMTTRMLCTMAMARRSAPSSDARISTCDIAPGSEAR